MEKKYPKIGLALGSGSARAVSQLGLLKGFQENNIQISCIMGSSMGAVVGAVYALGLDIDATVEKGLNYSKKTNYSDLSNLNLFHESLIKEDFIVNMLKEIFGDATFDDCKIPFSVISVDLESGHELIINKGYIWEALQASTAIPLVFMPVFRDGHYLVDGGLLEDTPVLSLRKNTDCDIIIGSTVPDLKDKQLISGIVYKKFYQKKKPLGFFSNKIDSIKTDIKLFLGIFNRSIDILRQEVIKYRIAEAKPDFIFKMSFGDATIFGFDRTPEYIEIGRKHFNENLPTIQKIIDQKINELNDAGKNVNLKEHNDAGWTTS